MKMLVAAVVISLAHQLGTDAASCPSTADEAVTAQTVCEKLEGSRYDLMDRGREQLQTTPLKIIAQLRFSLPRS